MADLHQRPHALIVEDELIIALGLQAQLSDLGFRSFSYASAVRQAVEQAELSCPDLVTVDVGLLDGSGLDAAEAILQVCGPLPIIYVTGDRNRAPSGAPALIVEKPVSHHALAEALRHARLAPAQPIDGGVRTPYRAAEEGPSVI